MWTIYLITKVIALSAFLFLLPEEAPPLLGWGILFTICFIPFIALCEHIMRVSQRDARELRKFQYDSFVASHNKLYGE